MHQLQNAEAGRVPEGFARGIVPGHDAAAGAVSEPVVVHLEVEADQGPLPGLDRVERDGQLHVVAAGHHPRGARDPGGGRRAAEAPRVLEVDSELPVVRLVLARLAVVLVQEDLHRVLLPGVDAGLAEQRVGHVGEDVELPGVPERLHARGGAARAKHPGVRGDLGRAAQTGSSSPSTTGVPRSTSATWLWPTRLNVPNLDVSVAWSSVKSFQAATVPRLASVTRTSKPTSLPLRSARAMGMAASSS